MFTPTKSGTYMWQCHQEADIHVQMGMYGALVVYEPGSPAALTGPGKGQGGTQWNWSYTKDYVLMLSEFDLGQHKAEQFAGKAGAYNPVNFKPQYWFINGLSFPNTVHAPGVGVPFNFTQWELAHPGYDPFIVGSVGTAADKTDGDRVLLRVINMGFQVQPMHMHGFHAKILGSDQRAWPWANVLNVWDEGMEKNTLTIGSGETYEWLINFDLQSQSSQYQPGVETRYDPAGNLPVENGQAGFPAIPDMFAPGFAYIGGPVVGPDGNQGPVPPALPAELPITPGQYFPFHNHDDYKATNNGVYPGGMFTLIMTQ
jgi:FtsP/CotA-like multicopper oxidase with cupredoxin domain